MKLDRFGLLALSLFLPVTALADFQYQETTQITGGSMLNMIKMAGVFSRQAKQAGDPVVTSVYVQGNRMARVSSLTMEIIDLDKETIINVDLQKHTYTEMTFEQMRQQMEQAEERAKEQQAKQSNAAPQPQNQDHVDVKFKVNVRDTGASKEVSGLNTSESILTMQMEGTDTTNGQQGALAITNDMWLAPDIPGYDEMRSFSQKMALKMGSMFSGMSASMAAMQPGASQGMADLAKEVSKLKGIPIEQVMRMGATANGEPLPAASEAPLPPSSSGQQSSSTGDGGQQSLASKLSGLGFGGFGHKKQNPPPDSSNNSTNTTNNGQPNANQSQTANVLMESRTEWSSFGSTPIDPSKFDVPAGFREVQPPAMR